MTIVRPCIVFGPNVNNYISRFYENAPFGLRFRGEPDRNVQYIHEDDLAEAISGLLTGRHAGAFNATGDGVLTWQECAELAGLKVRTMPYGLAYRLNSIQWQLHMPGVESPPGNLGFIRYGWVCSNEKLKQTLGWQPKHDSRETFLQTMRARGVIPDAAGAEARDLSALKSSNGSDREAVAGPASQE
jgi:UDP-glucose 4-epimerase